MIVMTLLGALLGAEIFALVWYLVPRRTSLLVQLGRFDQRPTFRAARTASAGQPASAAIPGTVAAVHDRLGRVLTGWLAARGITYRSPRQDLALTGRTPEMLMGRKTVGAAIGFILALIGADVVRTAGVPLPAGAPVLLGGCAAIVLFFVPDVRVRREGAARRQDFEHALAGYMILVALEMAGSAAPAQALPAVAAIRGGWPVMLLRETLLRTKDLRDDAGHPLADLGARIGVSALVDLDALLQGVEQDGAHVRQTLTERGVSLRRRHLADAEGRAGQRDQSMLIAQILLGLGFVVFLIYPAVMNVLLL